MSSSSPSPVPPTTPTPPTANAAASAVGRAIGNVSVAPHLNSPAAGSDPKPDTVLPTKLVTVKPPHTSGRPQPAASQPQPPSALTSGPGGNSSAGASSGSGTSGVHSSAPPPLRVPPLPHWFVVFYAVIKDTDGRDKALKALQYGMRYVRWLMKQSPHRTQQAVALLAAIVQLATARSLPGSLSKQQPHTVDRAVARLPSAAISTAAAPLAAPTASATIDVPLPFHITVPLSLVDPLIAAIAQRLELLSGTFSTIRKGIRLFKWCYTVPAAHKNYHKFIHDYTALQRFYNANQASSDKAATQQQQQQQPPVTPLHVPGLPPLPLLSTVELVNSVLAILTDMSDDIDWYSKHTLLPKSWNATAARTTIVLWFVTVIVDLALSTRTAAIQYQQLQEAEAQLERASAADKNNNTQQLADPARAQLVAARTARSDVLYNSVLTWLKFFFDFGVALPSVLEQQTEREGLVQAMGCMSALVATYKLILAVK